MLPLHSRMNRQQHHYEDRALTSKADTFSVYSLQPPHPNASTNNFVVFVKALDFSKILVPSSVK